MLVLLAWSASIASAQVLVFTPSTAATFGSATWGADPSHGNLYVALGNSGTTYAGSGELTGPWIDFNFDGTNSNIFALTGNVLRSLPSETNLVARLLDGAVVGATPSSGEFTSSAYFDLVDNSNFSYGSTGAIGYWFEAEGNIFYGFMNITRSSSLGSEYTVNFWAYESTPNTAITVFSAVPEPSTYALCAGILMFSWVTWRRRAFRSIG